MTFTITLQPSGRALNVAPEETILAAGLRQGVTLPYGCKDGACGTCKCKKLSGDATHGVHQASALSPEEAAEGFLLTCCATPHSDMVLYAPQVARVGAFPVRKMPARVSALDRLSDDVMRITLQLPANERFEYYAGQYVDFILRDGKRRSYSMASAPHEGAFVELHVRHMPGGTFTDHVFVAMKEKEILRLEGPYGSFFLREESNKPLIFVASGTGFAPIKAVLEHMQHKNITRETVLYWGGRRPGDLYMDAWLQKQCAVMPHLRYVPVVSDALPEDAWQGRTGLVHHAVIQDWPDLSAHQVYACGAPIMVQSARDDLVTQCRLPEEEFFADSFTSEKDKTQPIATP